MVKAEKDTLKFQLLKKTKVKFKDACDEEGKSMTTVATTLIEKYVEEYEAKKKEEK